MWLYICKIFNFCFNFLVIKFFFYTFSYADYRYVLLFKINKILLAQARFFVKIKFNIEIQNYTKIARFLEKSFPLEEHIYNLRKKM